MAQVRSWAGLDVHAAKVIAATVDGVSGELRFRRLPGATSEVVAFCRSLREKRRQGSITKFGSQRARRLLVEAAWHYRRPPRVGRELARRQDSQPQHVTATSWPAQRRLHRTSQRLDAQRGKRRTIVAVAVARELTGFAIELG